MARFLLFFDIQTDRRLTDGQNRLLNPASCMRARGNNRTPGSRVATGCNSLVAQANSRAEVRQPSRSNGKLFEVDIGPAGSRAMG